MLTIRTGIMGHGKTLNAIKEVDQQAVEEGRPVYYHNVTGLKPDLLRGNWYEFEDPTRWFDLPDNAIIVIDEAQHWFRSHDQRKGVPEHLSRFELMRKGGHHVHLITQDPRFLDTHCRRLCTQHIHFLRIFGSGKLSRYQMERVYETVEKITTHKDADFSIVALDKKFFEVYTSSKAKHHFKFKPSKKFIIASVGLVVCAILIFNGYSAIFGGSQTSETPQSGQPLADTNSTVKDMLSGAMSGVVNNATGSAQPQMTYFESRQPRVPTIAATAPVYDELTRPQSFPRMYCISSSDPQNVEAGRNPTGVYNGVKSSCTCYTQQGTRLDTGFQTCMNAAQYGYFDHTRPDPQQTQQMQQASNQFQPVNPFTPPEYQQPEQLQTMRVTVIPQSKPTF